MRITVSLDTQAVITQPSPARAKAGGFVPLEVAFTRGSQAASLPEGASLTFVLKPKGQLTGGTLVLHADFSAAPGGLYLGVADFHTQPLMALFGLADDVTGNDQTQLETMAELAWTLGNQRFASSSFPIFVEAPLRREGDGAPSALPDLKANQAEAEAGTDNAKWMTPLRTAQAIAALGGGGGGFILRQASFHAENGKAYLVGVSPDGGGYVSAGDTGSDVSGSGGGVGSPETEITITLPPSPSPADAIVILDAFGNWKPTQFGQSAIPVVIDLGGYPLDGDEHKLHSDIPLSPDNQRNVYLPCSCILTFADGSVGWRLTRIETGRSLDLGYDSTLSLCDEYPEGVMLKNSRGNAYPRFIVRHPGGVEISLGTPNNTPVLETAGNYGTPIRIGQQPQFLRAAGFVTLDGSKIEVPFYGTDDCKLATYAGATVHGNGLEEGAMRYNTVHGRPEILVKNPRPLSLTLTGTTHHFFANTFTLNGTYIWNDSGNRWNGNPLPTPYATKEAPVFQNWSGVLPAQIRYNMTKWAIFVNNVEYAYLTWPGNPVYPPTPEQFPFSNLTWKLTATNEDTDFVLTYDTAAARWIALDGSGL